MTLYIPHVDLCVNSDEDYITDLVIENQKLFSDILIEMNKQTKGIPSNVIISEEGRIISALKHVELIWNPITIDINSQRIVKKLYQDICELSFEIEDDILELNCKIVACLDMLVQKLPYNISYEYNIDVVGLLKLYKVRVDQDMDSMAEAFLGYIKILHQLCEIDYFFVVNLKDYFSENDVNEIYKYCIYEKITLINMSNAEKGYYDYEKRYIIDSDLCIIKPE